MAWHQDCRSYVVTMNNHGTTLGSTSTSFSPYLGWSLVLHGLGLFVGISLSWQSGSSRHKPLHVELESLRDLQSWESSEQGIFEEDPLLPTTFTQASLQDLEFIEVEDEHLAEEEQVDAMIEPLQDSDMPQANKHAWLKPIMPGKAQPVAVAVRLETPIPIHELNKPPTYPKRAMSMGIHGTVLLLVWVTAEGMVDQCHIQQSSGSQLLDQEALRAVRLWKFRNSPGTVQIPVKFVLEDHHQ